MQVGEIHKSDIFSFCVIIFAFILWWSLLSVEGNAILIRLKIVGDSGGSGGPLVSFIRTLSAFSLCCNRSLQKQKKLHQNKPMGNAVEECATQNLTSLIGIRCIEVKFAQIKSMTSGEVGGVQMQRIQNRNYRMKRTITSITETLVSENSQIQT